MLIAISINMTGCSFSLDNIMLPISTRIDTIIVKSDDPYGRLVRHVCKKLLNNNIKVTEYNNTINNKYPILTLGAEKDDTNPISIFINGNVAEYFKIIRVDAQLFLPSKGTYPFEIIVGRSFFNTPNVAIVNDSEQYAIIEEMYECIAEKLLRKLYLLIHPTIK